MDYRQALEKAVTYIEAHLLEEICVGDVARHAGYSYYHLTRQFFALLGESVGSYIKKRRLAEAAKQLLHTDRRILDIAVEYGFESGEAFNRAFKGLYGASPSRYRANGQELFIGAKVPIDSSQFHYLSEHVTVHPRITELPDIKVAGLRGETTLQNNVLPQLWRRFNGQAHLIPHRPPNARGFGICEACEENNLYNMSRDVLFSEVAGVEVSSFDGLPTPFTPKTLRAGKYAVFTHTGSTALLPQTFAYIWSTWFFSTKEKLDDREDFELYDHRYLGYNHPNAQIDLYIPIR